MKNSFCTYLTTYSGNKLPPFYIGMSTVNRILKKGYHGTVSSIEYKEIWNSELKNNPQLFKTFILTTHHLKIEASTKEEYFQRKFNVHKNPMYCNKSIGYALFYGYKGTSKPMLGKNHSDEAKAKIKEARARQKIVISNKTKSKIRSTLLGHKVSDETRKKISESNATRILTDKQLNNLRTNFLGKTHSEESKQKMRETWRLKREAKNAS